MKNSRSKAFTLIELLIVISSIAILAALVLQAAGFIQKKAARAKATSEIAAMGAALEAFKADNGDYPTNNISGSASLVTSLMPTNGAKVYYTFKAKFTNAYGYIDPYGYNYNYIYANETSPNNGTNNYDLWSTAGGQPSPSVWIKNW